MPWIASDGIQVTAVTDDSILIRSFRSRRRYSAAGATSGSEKSRKLQNPRSVRGSPGRRRVTTERGQHEHASSRNRRLAEPTWATTDLVGFDVEATDGKVGKVDEKTKGVQNQGFIVDTGPWILGKKVLLPAGIIQSIELDEEKVYVERMKDEIKNALEFDEATFQSSYQNQIGDYYGRSQPTR